MTLTEPSEAATQGHLLRSIFLNEFATIEEWIGSAARTLLSEKYSPAAPLSNKLKAIRDDLKSASPRFQHPTHVDPLIDEIARFSKMRANLVHSKLTVAATEDGQKLWLFRNCAYSLPDNEFSAIENERSLTAAIEELNRLRTKLEKQRLKPTPPTPAAPAATSDKA